MKKSLSFKLECIFLILTLSIVTQGCMTMIAKKRLPELSAKARHNAKISKGDLKHENISELKHLKDISYDIQVNHHKEKNKLNIVVYSEISQTFEIKKTYEKIATYKKLEMDYGFCIAIGDIIAIPLFPLYIYEMYTMLTDDDWATRSGCYFLNDVSESVGEINEIEKEKKYYREPVSLLLICISSGKHKICSNTNKNGCAVFDLTKWHGIFKPGTNISCLISSDQISTRKTYYLNSDYIYSEKILEYWHIYKSKDSYYSVRKRLMALKSLYDAKLISKKELKHEQSKILDKL